MKNSNKNNRLSEGLRNDKNERQRNKSTGENSEMHPVNNDEKKKENENVRRMDEETNTSGYGSGQRANPDTIQTVGPLDPDFAELPSKKRKNNR